VAVAPEYRPQLANRRVLVPAAACSGSAARPAMLPGCVCSAAAAATCGVDQNQQHQVGWGMVRWVVDVMVTTNGFAQLAKLSG
jgi:hypothetical protein